METKLHGWHLSHGARMVDFGGWDMPVQYTAGPREEHVRVREAAGLFDIDHMGRLEVTGPHALDFLQRMQTWDLAHLAPGRAHYSMLLNDAGGIIDDIFVYHCQRTWLVVVNASNAPSRPCVAAVPCPRLQRHHPRPARGHLPRGPPGPLRPAGSPAALPGHRPCRGRVSSRGGMRTGRRARRALHDRLHR